MKRLKIALVCVCCSIVVNASRINYDALYEALAWVESNAGATSANTYQLTRIYVADLKRISGWAYSYDETIASDSLARKAMRIYWDHYGAIYAAKYARPVTHEVLAKLHNCGLKGMKKYPKRSETYWKKVKTVMKSQNI